MTKPIVNLLFFVLIFQFGFAQLSNESYRSTVNAFVECIKNRDVDMLDSHMNYPFDRPYPVPAIRDKNDLIARYDELFDDSLTAWIVNSDILNDWSDVGWRGIMLHHGILWLDYDGKLKAINYSSQKEKLIEQERITYERNLLYPDLQHFEKPIHTLQTAKFIVRIDQMADETFRYACWSIHSNMSSKPDLILDAGEWVSEGSGGNHRYTFVNGIYEYIVQVDEMTADSPKFKLIVKKNNKVVLNQPAVLRSL